MMGGWLLLAIATAGISVEVQTLAGDSIRGELTAIRGSTLKLMTPAAERGFEFSELLTVRPAENSVSPVVKPTVWIELIDGSRLMGQRLTAMDGVVSLSGPDGSSASVASRSILAIKQRDHVGEPEFAKQWQEIAKEKMSGDVIVIRRPAGLDQLTGTLFDIGPDSLQFEFDGQRLDVKRERLDGWFYYRPAQRELPARICRLVERNGNVWHVRSLELVDQQLELVSAAGIKHALPLTQIQELDFSSGNTIFLSDLEPESSNWRPYLKSRLPDDLLARLFQPRKDRGPDGGPLMLGGKTYAKGLSIPSRTELTYRLTDNFRQFHAVVGIDDSVRDGGNVDVTISGDDKELFAKRITGRDPPLTIDLDLTGVRRLRILVDFGGELDIADHLDFCDARITK